jgi:DNA-binding beta-propeller fold protein YncE
MLAAAVAFTVCMAGGLGLASAGAAGGSDSLSVLAGVTRAAAPGPATLYDDLNSPRGVAVDTATGDMFIADSANDVIEEVTPTGHLSIIAGRQGQAGGPTPGPAASSELSSPQGVAVDQSTGDLFIADSGNDVVEQLTPAGTLSIVAGEVGKSGKPTPGAATRSELGDPAGVAVDSSTGDVFIADNARDVIEEVTPARQLSIVAGRINHTNVPTPGPATSSDLNGPEGVAVDSTNGNLFIADSGNATVDEVAGGQLSIVAGIASYASVPTPGPATSSNLDGDLGVAVDSSGDVFIADTRNDLVEEVTPAGQLSIVAGKAYKSGTPTPGPATSTKLNSPAGLAVDSSGDVVIADTGNNLIDDVTPAGQLSIVTGRGGSGPSIPGPAVSSPLNNPSAAAANPSTGDVFIADSGNNVVEKVTPAGQLSIIAGQLGNSGAPTPGPATSSMLNDPTRVAVDSAGDVFIADSGNDVVEEVTPGGQLSIVAGVAGTSGLPTPGPATSSDLGDPSGVALDTSTGDLFIADSANCVIEEVTPAGQLSIIAGHAGHGGQPVAGPATGSYMNYPNAVAVDSATNDIFIADTTNQSIEEVTPAGTLSVLVGAAAGLDYPSGIAVDRSSGDVYIADTYNDVVRQLTPAGTLSIVAGQSGLTGTPPSGLATSSRLTYVQGVGFDAATGALFIADAGNNDVEQVLNPAPAPAPAVSGVTPDSGPVAGSTPITVKGSGFVTGATVLITQGHGISTAIPAADVTVFSPTKLSALVAGPAKAGKWAVLVVEPAGTSAANKHDSYEYLPTVSSVSPRRGPTSGATRITIKGTGFAKGAKVVISQRRGPTRAIKATHVKVASSTKITAVTPGKAKPGTWNVFVVEQGATSTAVSGDHYRYTK